MASKLQAQKVSTPETIQTTFKKLSDAALDLNAASDELAKPIRVCEVALKKLNLGISAWVQLSGGDGLPDDRTWWDRGLGYAPVKDGWGIALRTREGYYGAEENDSETIWPFNDAPRWMRLEAVAKLPDLLESLLKQAEETTQRIRKKRAQADEFAAAINMVADATPQDGE